MDTKTTTNDDQIVRLSPETLGIFKSLYEVDQSLRIDHNMIEEDDVKIETVLRSKSFNNTTMAKVKINETFPRDVNIYDLREFISVISIVNEPYLNLENDKYIVIGSGDGKQKLRYVEANPDLINSYSSRDPALSSEDEQLVVTEAQLKSIMTAAQTLKFEYVGLVSDGEKTYITAFSRNDGSNNETNKYSIELKDSDKEYKMLYKLQLQNISILLGEGDLLFTIDGKKKISKIDTESGKSFWVSFDATSEFTA